MYQQMVQQIRQIRMTCQQLAQIESQNAQILSQTGMLNMAQRETMTSQQLQQCVNLCAQMEQSVSQVSNAGFSNQFIGGAM